MKELELKIKLSYVTGLRSVVLKELEKINLSVFGESEDSVYIDFSKDHFLSVKRLRSVARAYLILQGGKYHPSYISNHKSVLGNIVDLIVEEDTKNFSSYKISCAGSDSPEVKSISNYIKEKYDLIEKDEADLKIHIIKSEDVWEVGAQVTTRPLSVRDYKVANMSGAMDPTIAFAVNSFCNLEKTHSYLNIFSGSATLLIEAGQCYPNLEKLIGFDNNKKHLSISVKNIKKAGLIDKIQIKEGDIYDKPDFGKFDAITSDLPFGMSISKNEDIEKLYKSFVEYCEEKLNPNGRLVIYTSEYEIIESVLAKSSFNIIQSLQLKFITNVNAYLRPKVIICEYKNN